MTATNTSTTPRDWDAIGLSWEALPVSKRMGEHATDDVEIGKVQKPVVVATKLDALIAHFGGTRVASWLVHSSSLEVRSRAWYKQRWNKDQTAIKRMDVETMREAVYQNVLMSSGTRGSRTIVTETRIVIGPFTRIVRSGEVVTYAELFGAANAALIDAMPGAPPDVIRNFVAQSLETAGFTPDDDSDDESES